MQPAWVPRPAGGTTARAHLYANISAAADGGWHPGDWRSHSFAVADGPGDFTPFTGQPEYAEYTEFRFSPFGELLEHLAEVLGPDHDQVIADRGLEAGL